MKHRLPWIIYDYECGSTYTDIERMCPLEIAAVVLDSRTLEIVDGGIFQSFMRPSHILDSISPDDPLIQDGALAVNGISRSQIVSFPEEKMVWKNFVDFCLKYAMGKSVWERCPKVGWNNSTFDDIITANLCIKHSSKIPFHKNLSLDLMNEMFHWAEGITGESAPEKMAFDYWRDYLGIPDNSEYGEKHTGLRDVVDCAMVFRRFQEWKRRLIKKNPLKGSFSVKSV